MIVIASVAGAVSILDIILTIFCCRCRKAKKEDKEVEIVDDNFYYGEDGGEDYQESKFVDKNEYYEYNVD